MSTDRPNRLTDRISGIWNGRHRADRNSDLLSTDRPSQQRPSFDNPSDHPADRFTNRQSARFSDLEPLIPESASSSAPSPVPGPSALSASAAPPSPRPSLAPSLAPAPSSTPAPNLARTRVPQPSEPTPRAVGAPLPTGSASAAAPSTSSSMQLAFSPITGPTQPGKNLALGRGLPPAETPPMDIPYGIQRVINAVRSSLPFIQRILPLLDGNVGTVVSNLMAPPHRPAPPPPPVNLAPLEEGISSLQAQQHELRAQIADQNTSLKRVEDQLEMVREATDRNTLEQQDPRRPQGHRQQGQHIRHGRPPAPRRLRHGQRHPLPAHQARSALAPWRLTVPQ